LSIDLLSAGVAGFYRNTEQKLYVISRGGSLTGAEKIAFAHEYDHALQDQNFSVFRDQRQINDETDRLLARQAVYEGDATTLMFDWARAHFSADEWAEYLRAANDPEMQQILARIPPILLDTLLWPYSTGYAFVLGAKTDGGWTAVDRMYADMPVSSEQILHPAKYKAHEKPIDVSLPNDLARRLGSGWTEPYRDTLGEFQLAIWLKGGGNPSDAASQAAAGWGGDRVAVLQGPGGAWAVVLRTDWDSARDATEFEVAATKALGKAIGANAVLPGEDGSTRWVVVASSASTLGDVRGALGLAG
ncbi:MAG: hypothetical protein ACJ761_00830, partial [Chloroflexota bacterium]